MYQTLDEIKQAWFQLKSQYGCLNSLYHYQQYYKKDSLLCSWQTIRNKFGIRTWNEFVTGKKELQSKKYKTLLEVKEAWNTLKKRFGLSNQLTIYNQNYKKDPKLPAWNVIRKRYKIRSWYDFID